MTVFDMVKEFHEIFDHPVGNEPNILPDLAEKRIHLIVDESQELFEAAFKFDLVEILDALADIVYYIEGSAVAFGLGPVELVDYPVNEKVTPGSYSVLLVSTFPLLEQAAMNGDIYYTRTSLSILKSSCYAIAKSYGVDLEEVISAVHKSNMTKLGADGKPIYYTEGADGNARKVAKGPNYKTPTEDIRKIAERVQNSNAS